MTTDASTTPPRVDLSAEFADDEWFKFTEKEMDEDLVSVILANEQEPDNAAHATSEDTLTRASNEFMDENGVALFAALTHLANRKGR
jgi:hypothetical protein